MTETAPRKPLPAPEMQDPTEMSPKDVALLMGTFALWIGAAIAIGTFYEPSRDSWVAPENLAAERSNFGWCIGGDCK